MKHLYFSGSSQAQSSTVSCPICFDSLAQVSHHRYSVNREFRKSWLWIHPALSLKAVCLPASSFIHSFIQVISIATLQVHYYSEALLTQHRYCVGVSHQSATGICE